MSLCIAYSLSGLRRLNDFKIANRRGGRGAGQDKDFRDSCFMERIIYRTAVKKRKNTEAKNITSVPAESSYV